MTAPALIFAVPLLGGAATAILCIDLTDYRFAVVASAAAALALMAAAGWTIDAEHQDATVATALGCLFVGLSLGTSAARDAYDTPLQHWFRRASPAIPVVVEGVLREDAAPTPLGVALLLDVFAIDGVRLRTPGGGLRLSVGGTLAAREVREWRAGRTLRTAALLRRPSTYLNPGTPDQLRPLARRGIVLVGTVKSGALVEVVRNGSRIDEWASAIRMWTRARIAAHLAAVDAKSAGVTIAVLIGDRSGLDSEDERRLQEAGTYHVIAISGGNIAILAVLALAVCRVLLVPAPFAAVFTGCGLIFYGLIAAGSPSVARAVTVAVVVLAARALDHRGSPVNALAVAAASAVVVSPVVVLDAGFLLSFGATLGIVLGVPLLVAERSREKAGARLVRRRAGQAAARLLAATVCAEIALAPVAATTFSRVTFAGLLLNFAAIPLMTVVQVSGLTLALTSGWWPAIAGAAGWAAHLGAAGLLRASALVDVAPWLSVPVSPPVGWLTLAYYACALGVLLPRIRSRAAILLSVAGMTMLIGPSATSRDAVSPSTLPVRIVVLDVGQGDATVIQLPDERALLVDAGGLVSFSSPDAPEPSFDVGDRVVTPALRALGAWSLHAMVITHGDPDHVLGAKGVLRGIAASSIWEGIPVPPHPGMQMLAGLARARGTTWRNVQAGDVERFGDVEIKVLHPALPEWERQRVRNEDSIVLEIRIGSVSVILPGDIGREGEQAILSRLEPGRLVVLKAPHHGSATSSTNELLRLLHPAAVVFSCGRDNRFGHPHPAVVARYREIGASVYSTAEDGAVFIETDGRNLEVRGWARTSAR